MNKNMTKEELKYYNSLSKKEKISYSLKHRSKEDKEEAEKKRQESRSKWSSEYRDSINKKISNTKNSKSKEEKQKIIDKFHDTLNNKTEEEKFKKNKKVSEGLKKYFDNRTDEQKEAFSRKMSETYSRMSDEWKENRIKKIKETREERYGKGFNSMQLEEVKEKIRNTNLDRYGVPYFCMTDKCRNASGGNSANSSINLEFEKLLIENNIKYEKEFPIDKYSFDFKVGNTLIELNPSVTHNLTWAIHGKPKDKYYHRNKSNAAYLHGYRCITIWDWDDKNKIINLLKIRDKIYARECHVEEVNNKDSKLFIEDNHLQGYVKASINVGLYYNSELISIMTFGKPRYNKKFEYELIRYCSKYSVIGGAEKLFNYFKNKYNPTSVVSYCDKSKFSGEVYDKLGFSVLAEMIEPSKHWYDIKTGKHITDNLLRQRGFDQLFNTDFGKGTSNEELMLSHGFVEIYDCGQSTFVYTEK